MSEPTSFVIVYRNALRDEHKLPTKDKLSAKAKLVAYTLAQHTNEDGKNAYPSYELLADEAPLARSSVALAIRELIDKQWVVREGGSGEVHPNRYSLRLPPSVSRTLPREKAPSESCRGTVRLSDSKESKARREPKPSLTKNQDHAVGKTTSNTISDSVQALFAGFENDGVDVPPEIRAAMRRGSRKRRAA